MSLSLRSCKFSIYGDSFMTKLCPLLKKKLKLDIKDILTRKNGTIAELHERIALKYRREKREKKDMNDAVLVMVGTYDIMKFKKKCYGVKRYANQLYRRLKAFVNFLLKYHKHIILMTALPVLKMQEQLKHWKLLKRYNSSISRLTDKTNVNVVDLFPVFVETLKPPRCNHRFYYRENCPPSEKNVMWNYPAMRMVLGYIRQVVVNVQKLQSTHEEIKEEICNDQTIMTNKFDDVCPPDDGHQCSAVNYFRDSSAIDRNARIFESGQTGYIHSSKAGATLESIYNSNTNHLMEDIKQKLSWIRFTEYSNYGKELVKSNKIKSIENDLLTIATYNVLSQDLLEKHNYLYLQHDHRSLNWSIRGHILLEELALLDADILCLQEIDSHLLEPFYEKFLRERGYQGVYKRRTHEKVDGCAIYFRSTKFNLVESSKVEFFKESVRLLDKDNIGIVLKLSLKNDPEAEFIVATTHLLYNPKRLDIKLAQTQVMLAEIERLAYKRTDRATGEPEYLPIIFTGDMNYSPESAIYRLVTESHLEYEGLTIRFRSQWSDGCVLKKTLLPATAGVTDFCQLTSTLSTRDGLKKVRYESGTLSHWLNLASVYDHVKKDIPETTTNQGEWLTVDYIFYSRSGEKPRRDRHLKLISKLTLPNIREAEAELRSIPNLACASDHLPLLATFHLTGS